MSRTTGGGAFGLAVAASARHRDTSRRSCSLAYDLFQMAAPHDRVLLAPGNEAEWAKINEEEARQEAEFAASLTMEERVTLGQQLSQQAFSLLVASVKAGHVPERALWS